MESERIAEQVRRRVLEDHGDVVSETVRCADRVASGWSGDSTDDRREVTRPLSSCLRRHGLLKEYVTVLIDSADAAGYNLPAEPVPSPPYVVVTSTGLLLRATLPVGRLLVRFHLFDVDREPAPRYVRRDCSPEDVLEVTLCDP